MPLVYGHVARGGDGAVLASFAAPGSGAAAQFRAAALEALSRAPPQQRAGAERFALPDGRGYAHHFLAAGGYTVAVTAHERDGAAVAYACAKKIGDAWVERYWERGRGLAPGAMDGAFGPVIRQQLEYAQAHPEEMTKLASVQAKVCF